MSSLLVNNDTAKAVELFEEKIIGYQDHFNKLLEVKNINPDEFITSVINTIKRNPKLLECQTGSLFGSILMSAELGLSPNTPHGLSWIIPYNNNKGTKQTPNYVMEAQFQIGYQGWIEIFNRHPKIENVYAELVFQNDHFKQVKFPKPTLEHIPTNDDRGKRRGAYAVAFFKDSDNYVWCYMPESDIMKIKKMSKGGAAWDEEKDPMGWMWKKCVIKQIAKMLPKTHEVEKAIYAQDTEEVGKTIKAEGTVIKLDPIQTEEDKNKQLQDENNKEVEDKVGDIFKPKS